MIEIKVKMSGFFINR